MIRKKKNELPNNGLNPILPDWQRSADFFNQANTPNSNASSQFSSDGGASCGESFKLTESDDDIDEMSDEEFDAIYGQAFEELGDETTEILSEASNNASGIGNGISKGSWEDLLEKCKVTNNNSGDSYNLYYLVSDSIYDYCVYERVDGFSYDLAKPLEYCEEVGWHDEIVPELEGHNFGEWMQSIITYDVLERKGLGDNITQKLVKILSHAHFENNNYGAMSIGDLYNRGEMEEALLDLHLNSTATGYIPVGIYLGEKGLYSYIIDNDTYCELILDFLEAHKDYGVKVVPEDDCRYELYVLSDRLFDENDKGLVPPISEEE